jgi:hypothetical protein
LILVYQMAKVASQSWAQAVCALDSSQGVASIHVHNLTAASRDRVWAALRLPPARQTIDLVLMARDELRRSARIEAALRQALARGEPVRVITGMRDPVERSLSILFYLADFLSHRHRRVSARQDASVDDVVGLLIESWEAVASAQAPNDSFEWLLWHGIGLYRDWFQSELQAVFGIDLLSEPFTCGAQRLRGPRVDVLAYRAEDMRETATDHARLLAVASEFLAASLTAFGSTNSARTRHSFPLYQAVAERLRLPSRLLDPIYDHPVVRHFYTEAEIADRRRHWSRP